MQRRCGLKVWFASHQVLQVPEAHVGDEEGTVHTSAPSSAILELESCGLQISSLNTPGYLRIIRALLQSRVLFPPFLRNLLLTELPRLALQH
jgi:hypothetical protein